MKFKYFKMSIAFIIMIAVFSSCTSNKKIIYLQSNGEQLITGQSITYEPVLKSDDVLMIVVSAENSEVAAPYNMKLVSVLDNSDLASGRERIQTYLIDKDGAIEFPMFGKI